MNYIEMEIEPTEVYRWDRGNTITIVYVNKVGCEDADCEDADWYARITSSLAEKNNGIWGTLRDFSFNRDKAVEQLRKKISKEYVAATRKVDRLARQYEEAK